VVKRAAARPAKFKQRVRQITQRNINIFLGGAITPDKAIVQLPGGAMRMKANPSARSRPGWGLRTS
jgi:hypothetical protein